jgi:hypothetical protein
MEEKKEWLEKVLNDASADVEAWPNWMKDGEHDLESARADAKSVEKKENNRRRSASA